MNCPNCDKPLITRLRSRYLSGRLKHCSMRCRIESCNHPCLVCAGSIHGKPKRKYCSQKCKGTAMVGANRKIIVGKSGCSYRARRLSVGACLSCGATEKIHVHHIDHDYTNNVLSNLITLCSKCHLGGHRRKEL